MLAGGCPERSKKENNGVVEVLCSEAQLLENARCALCEDENRGSTVLPFARAALTPIFGTLRSAPYK